MTQDRPDLRAWDLVFIDVEATGAVFGFHEIIEIAVIRTDSSAVELRGTWHRHLRPSHPERISPKAQEVTGFSVEAWAKYDLSSREVWESFADFCRGCVPVCHNPSFDRAQITLAASASGVTELGVDYHWIGTESLSWPLYKSGALEKMSLEHLGRYFQVPPEPIPHNAVDGAALCRAVYSALMATLDAPYGKKG